MISHIGRALAGRSPGQILRLAAKTAAHHLKSWSPSARGAVRADRAFDARWGTDTSAEMTMSRLDYPPELRRLSHHYQASGPHLLDIAVACAGIDPADFVFIDYGCGKGRVALLALQRFARSIGVEYSPILIAIAERNAAQFVARGGAARHPSFWQGNAADYAPPPDGHLFCYLYNSFGAEILSGCLDRLEAAKATLPARRIMLAYVDPRHAALVTARERWEVRGEAAGLMIFELG